MSSFAVGMVPLPTQRKPSQTHLSVNFLARTELRIDSTVGAYRVCLASGQGDTPVHADIPDIDVSWIDEPDLNFNPIGCRGLG